MLSCLVAYLVAVLVLAFRRYKRDYHLLPASTNVPLVRRCGSSAADQTISGLAGKVKPARRGVVLAFWHIRLVIVQELCESRGGRPGLSVLTSLLVSVDVKLY